MAYAQWVVVRITNSFRNGRINVKNAKLSWGKFHENGNKDREVSVGDVNKIEIGPGSTVSVSSCGRSDSSSGTEGHFDLWEGGTRICTIYWNCPCGSKTNDFAIRDRNASAGYMVSLGDWDRDSGAIGYVDLEIAKKG